MRLERGLLRAATNFAIVGVLFPYLLEYYSPQISSYVPLPPAYEVWAVFLAIGAGFAVTGFLQGAYSKGDYPWLFGKLASGVVSIAFFTFMFSLLPSSIGSAGEIQASGLLYLIYLAVALSYGYLVLDFFEARRTKAFKPQETGKML